MKAALRYLFSRLIDVVGRFDCLEPVLVRIPERWMDQADWRDEQGTWHPSSR